ncbi:MAG: GNAT family N-acetyltransferase [Gudongella sp.]|nr:GNAT family N-acetyltransferase [Gudongella sp.]
MKILIRGAELTDLTRVIEIERICFPEAEAASEDSLEKRIRIFKGSFYVAVVEGEIVGFINGGVTNERVIHDEMFSNPELHNPEGEYQSIFGLDVVPQYQHQGIAAKLMEHMITMARNSGRKGLILTCKEHLLDYYSRFGFGNMGLSESSHGGAVWFDMLLEF